VKEALPRSTLLGPVHVVPSCRRAVVPVHVVPLYVTPFTISLSQQLSVLKAVALKS